MEKINKIICVTGASTGIGYALSKELITQGYTVIGLSRRKIIDPFIISYECDVSNISDVQRVFKDLNEKKILPNTIICGAGIYNEDTKPEFNPEKVKETMNVNFYGTMHMVQVFLNDFISKKEGHFIALSSIASFKPSARGISYSASKSAQAMAFRGLDLAYRKLGVAFSTIYLGPVKTNMWEGKESFVVTTPNKIAKNIISILESKKTVLFTPFLSTTLARIGLLIPDSLYAKLSTYLFK